jgi:hypothetical protein
MTEINRDREMRRFLDSDELDRALDSALAKYAAVEPKAGLENRIWDKLRERPAEAQLWWRWSWAVAVAVVVVTAVLVWRSTRLSRPLIADRTAVENRDLSKPVVRVASSSRTPKPVPIHRVRVNSTSVTSKRPLNLVTVVASAKLGTFPSPRELSPQEQMLASYVARFHNQAVLIAEVVNEESRQERAAMFGPEEEEEVNIQNVERGK